MEIVISIIFATVGIIYLTSNISQGKIIVPYCRTKSGHIKINYKKLRCNLQNEKYLLNLKKLYLERSDKLHEFYQFKCSKFFVGKQLAENNLKHYHWGCREIDKKLALVDRCLMWINKNTTPAHFR